MLFPRHDQSTAEGERLLRFSDVNEPQICAYLIQWDVWLLSGLLQHGEKNAHNKVKHWKTVPAQQATGHVGDGLKEEAPTGRKNRICTTFFIPYLYSYWVKIYKCFTVGICSMLPGTYHNNIMNFSWVTQSVVSHFDWPWIVQTCSILVSIKKRCYFWSFKAQKTVK